MRKFFVLALLIFIGCGGNNKKEIKSSMVNVIDNKIIHMTLSSVVGLNDYIVGAYSKNYSSIITVANPYQITYVNCVLDKDESNYFIYKCNAYQNYCEGFNCVQISIDNDKLLLIDKENPTYLYEQNTYEDKKYIIGEFNYNGNLSFKQYNSIKVE